MFSRLRATRTCSLASMAGVLLSVSVLACDGASGTTEPSGAPAAAVENKAPEGEPAVPAAEEPAKEAAQAEPAENVAPSEPAAPGAPAATGAEVAPAGEAAATGAAAPEPAQAEAEKAPSPDADAAAEPIKVLMLGDSLAATGFGVLVEKGLDAHPQVTCFRKGKSASGLARPDFFNWMEESRKQIDWRQPEVVVVIMGGNDGQDLTTKTGKGKRVHWDSDEWKVAYRERMDDFLAHATEGERRIIWLGLPKMGMRSLEKKLVTIREIQEAAVLALGDRGVYVDTTPFLVDEEGNLKEFGHLKGKKKRIRAEDGIHFTMAGSEFLANHVVPEILNQIGLAPV